MIFPKQIRIMSFLWHEHFFNGSMTSWVLGVLFKFFSIMKPFDLGLLHTITPLWLMALVMSVCLKCHTDPWLCIVKSYIYLKLHVKNCFFQELSKGVCVGGGTSLYLNASHLYDYPSMASSSYIILGCSLSYPISSSGTQHLK